MQGIGNKIYPVISPAKETGISGNEGSLLQVYPLAAEKGPAVDFRRQCLTEDIDPRCPWLPGLNGSYACILFTPAESQNSGIDINLFLFFKLFYNFDGLLFDRHKRKKPFFSDRPVPFNLFRPGLKDFGRRGIIQHERSLVFQILRDRKILPLIPRRFRIPGGLPQGKHSGFRLLPFGKTGSGFGQGLIVNSLTYSLGSQKVPEILGGIFGTFSPGGESYTGG